MRANDNLVRKQYLISSSQVKKIELLAKKQNKSAAEMVRNAIDAFNPDVSMDMNESELLDLVSARVKEAIADTRKTRSRLQTTLEMLGARGD
jgi:adenylate cyclase